MVTLALTASLYGIAAVVLWVSFGLGTAMLEPSPINRAESDGNRILALMCAAIAVLAATGVALSIARQRARRVVRGDPGRLATFAAMAAAAAALAQAIMWSMGGSRWVGALVNDDAHVQATYGQRGWLLVGAFVATAACGELMRRAAGTSA